MCGGGGGGGGRGRGGEGGRKYYTRRGQFALGQNVPGGTTLIGQIIRGDILRYYTGTGSYILALLQLLIKVGLLNSIKLCLYLIVQWLLSQYFHGSGKLVFRVVLHLQFHAASQTSKL